MTSGVHTAAINRVSTDALGQYLLTASDDKTLRLWSLESGKQLKTYRPMIGTNHEGKMFAGAISPDTRWVVGAGWARSDEQQKGGHNIYIFDRSNGQLVRRLPGLEGAVYHLCFSPDGQYLAAMLAGRNGLRVWSTFMAIRWGSYNVKGIYDELLRAAGKPRDAAKPLCDYLRTLKDKEI